MNQILAKDGNSITCIPYMLYRERYHRSYSGSDSTAMRKPAWPTTEVHVSPGSGGVWPDLITPEQLVQMPRKLQKAAIILGVAVSEMSSLLTLYEMAVILNNPTFMGKMLPTPGYAALYNVVVSIFSSIYIGLDALLGMEDNSVNLKRVINIVIRKDERNLILDFYLQTSIEARIDAERMIERIVQLRNRLNKGKSFDSFLHVKNMRNKRLAHFDYVEGKTYSTLNIRHIQICLINLGRLVDLLCRVLIQRAHNMPRMRAYAQSNAIAFRDTLLHGAGLR